MGGGLGGRAAWPGRRQSRVPPGCPQGRARAPVLWRHAAARHSATATRADAPASGAISTRLGHHRTTEPHRVSRTGNGGSVLSLPCPSVPAVVRITPAGVKEGPKWREQSQFAGRSKYLCGLWLSAESSPASREQSQFRGAPGPGRFAGRERAWSPLERWGSREGATDHGTPVLTKDGSRREMKSCKTNPK
jgi:hypothetical protein